MEVVIHRHEETAETMVCLLGKLGEEMQEEAGEQNFREVSLQLLFLAEGKYGMQIPVGAWYTVRVIEPSVIFNAKDGSFKR